MKNKGLNAGTWVAVACLCAGLFELFQMNFKVGLTIILIACFVGYVYGED